MIHEDTLSEVDLLDKVKIKLLGYGWPMDALVAGRKKIEETLGQNAALESLLDDISNKKVHEKH